MPLIHLRSILKIERSNVENLWHKLSINLNDFLIHHKLKSSRNYAGTKSGVPIIFIEF